MLLKQKEVIMLCELKDKMSQHTVRSRRSSMFNIRRLSVISVTDWLARTWSSKNKNHYTHRLNVDKLVSHIFLECVLRFSLFRSGVFYVFTYKYHTIGQSFFFFYSKLTQVWESTQQLQVTCSWMTSEPDIPCLVGGVPDNAGSQSVSSSSKCGCSTVGIQGWFKMTDRPMTYDLPSCIEGADCSSSLSLGCWLVWAFSLLLVEAVADSDSFLLSRKKLWISLLLFIFP